MSATNNLMGYAASANLTFTLASLASDSSLLAGRQCTVVDNTSNKYFDYLLSGFITVGTSPTVSTSLFMYAWALIDDGPTYPDTMGATDANVSLTSANVGVGFLKPVWQQTIDSTTNRVYYFDGISMAGVFGGSLPAKFGLWFVHNTAAALKSSGQQVTIKGAYTSSGN